jgi:peptidoglycan hydrolase-like protein with peptidoglycan-binding domain
MVEANSQALGLLRSVGLESPLPLLRLMMAQSNCFQVVDRGAALRNIQTEQNLQNSGLLQQGSTTARGRLVTAQYVVTPNVIFSNQDAGGSDFLGALGGLLGGSSGALAGSAAGSMRVQEAQTTLFLTDAQTGLQTAASEGSASVTDFAGRGSLAGWGSGIAGFGSIGGYGNTDEGKLIAAAFLDAHNKMVQQVRATQPNEPTVGAGAKSQRGNKSLVRAIQTQLKSRGYYESSIDGIYGKGTRAAIRAYQQDQNLIIDGQPSQGLLDHITGS